MCRELFEKIKNDPRILQTVKTKKKKLLVKLCAFIGAAYIVAFFLCLAMKSELFGWIMTFLCLTVGTALCLLFCVRRFKKEPLFLGKITRIETERKIVPQKGTAAFGRLPMKTAEVYELLVAVSNEKEEVRVIFCPAQHEAVLKLGDTLLCHAELPYPAHLSNPTKCICMHCGTMQSVEGSACITCGADMYNLYTLAERH